MSYRKKHIKPHLKRLKPKKPLFKKPVFWLSTVFLFILVIFYFIIFSWFQISKINISGNDKINTEDIEKIANSVINKKIIPLSLFNINSRSIFLLNKKKISDSIINNFPDIGQVNVTKKLPGSVEILIKERIQFSVFCNENNECFSMDDNGVIYDNFLGELQGNLILQKSNDYQAHNLGQNVIEKSIVNNIKDVKHSLKENFQIEIQRVIISNYLQFKTLEGWSAYFDPASDMKLQISKINALLNEEISEEKRKSLTYIYLQYKDRAYYK